MYLNSTLIQQLNDSRLAERRREARSWRTPVIRRETARRIARPLDRLISH